MATNTLHVKHGWVWIFAILIFFFNSFLLPEGLTYTLLLTPMWLYLLYLQGRLSIATGILMPLTIFAVIHLLHGVDIIYYSRSILMIAGMTTFLVVSSFFINSSSINWDLIFRDISILNFFFTLLSFCLLFFPSINSVVWYKVPVSLNIDVPRLKLFTEEASHYSYLLAPVAIYFYSRAIFFKTTKPLLTLFIITVPFLASFSLGVLSAILFGSIVVFTVYFTRLFSTIKSRVSFFAGVMVIIGLLLVWYKINPGNILFVRIHNIFNGDDTSARGRTYEAFILANKVIAQKSYLWGIGPGQLKLIGRDIIVQYYLYSKIPEVIRIPNACAETIVCFGYVGFCIRLVVEAVLFFTTKVYTSPYRLWLFAFAFIYQFTGSYITNTAEYLVWIIAFSSMFPEYEKVWTATLKPLKA